MFHFLMIIETADIPMYNVDNEAIPLEVLQESWTLHMTATLHSTYTTTLCYKYFREPQKLLLESTPFPIHSSAHETP